MGMSQTYVNVGMLVRGRVENLINEIAQSNGVRVQINKVNGFPSSRFYVTFDGDQDKADKAVNDLLRAAENYNS